MSCGICFFFFNDTATTEIYTLSLHDALPISIEHCTSRASSCGAAWKCKPRSVPLRRLNEIDRKSTRLNSSHGYISYAVFCLKKKKKVQSIISSNDPSAPPARLYLHNSGLANG